MAWKSLPLLPEYSVGQGNCSGPALHLEFQKQGFLPATQLNHFLMLTRVRWVGLGAYFTFSGVWEAEHIHLTEVCGDERIGIF